MDSSTVNKQIKLLIKPYLVDNGFVKSSSRSFWKHNDENIFVINFQSFNSYRADVMNITTFSFSINLGVFWKNFPNHGEVKVKDNLQFPQEYQCQFRHALCKTFTQEETSFKTVWYIDKEGKNLNTVLNDAFVSIQKYVPSWFIKFSDKQECIKLLQEGREDMEGTWGFGNKNSPYRNLLTGYLAYWSGNNQLANESLRKVFNSDSFPTWKQEMQRLIELTA